MTVMSRHQIGDIIRWQQIVTRAGNHGVRVRMHIGMVIAVYCHSHYTSYSVVTPSDEWKPRWEVSEHIAHLVARCE